MHVLFQRIVTYCLAIIAVVGVFWLPIAVQGAFLPYGGRSVTAIPCTCMPGYWLITISQPGSRPPGVHTFMYGPSTQMRMNYNVFPPAWQLGYAGSPVTCIFDFGGKVDCAPIGAGPLWLLDGTSLY